MEKHFTTKLLVQTLIYQAKSDNRQYLQALPEKIATCYSSTFGQFLKTRLLTSTTPSFMPKHHWPPYPWPMERSKWPPIQETLPDYLVVVAAL
jgi:hypothetical protein